MIKFYNSDYAFKRKNLETLLNNWQGELDRAREYFASQEDDDIMKPGEFGI
jgi:hypothetical protein